MTELLGVAGVILLIAGLIYTVGKQAETKGRNKAQLAALDASLQELRKARGIEINLDRLTPAARRARLRDFAG